MRNLWTCPECGSPSRLRRSRLLPGGPGVTYQQCTEPACGWCGNATHLAKKTITESALSEAEKVATRREVASNRDARRPEWECFECHSRCTVRTSKQLLSDYRVTYLFCTNERCGWHGIGEYVVDETISPSGIPNPEYQRRLAEHLPYEMKPMKPPKDMFHELLLTRGQEADRV